MLIFLSKELSFFCKIKILFPPHIPHNIYTALNHLDFGCLSKVSKKCQKFIKNLGVVEIVACFALWMFIITSFFYFVLALIKVMFFFSFTRSEKCIVTFPNTTSGFSLPNHMFFVRSCFRCGAAGQKSRMIYNKWVDSLILSISIFGCL